MDPFTAKILLETLKVSATALAEVTVATYSFKGRGPSEAQVIVAQAMAGRKCSIRGTSYSGKVLGPNLTSAGLFAGDRYPVLVRVTLPNGTTEVFEYGFDSIILT